MRLIPGVAHGLSAHANACDPGALQSRVYSSRIRLRLWFRHDDRYENTCVRTESGIHDLFRHGGGRVQPNGSTPEHHWIPFLGWRRPDKALCKRIEERCSMPMMLVALMILPMLGLEFIWTSQLESKPWLWSAVDIGTRIIWLAFACEFLVRVSVSRKRIAYCKDHWVDLAIILLPLISFLRVLRLLRLGRLAKLQKMSRVYRMRGLAFRVLRAIMILRVLDRVSHRYAQKRLEHLRAKVDAKKEEIEDLHEEIAELDAFIRRMAEEREARAAAKAAAKTSD